VELKSLPSKFIEPDRSLGIVSGTKVGLALLTLIALNLLNHVSRNLFAGAQPVIQKAIYASDSTMGAVSSWFFIAYMFAAPLLGWLGDRFPRRILVPSCVLWWSCALGVAVARDFHWFSGAYMMVGAAEAAFGVYAIALVSDYYPHANRSKALSLFILAMTGGRALGFPLGGWLAQTFGWQAPFRFMVAVGILLGLLAMKFLFEPEKKERLRPGVSSEGNRSTVSLHYLGERRYLFAVLGLAMENFALGGLSIWLPTYLHRFAGYTVTHAAGVLGAVALVCGTAGTWTGGLMGEMWLRRDHRALYWISALGFFIAVPCVASILTYSRVPMLCGIVGVYLCLFMNLGPLNTAILNSVPASVRSTAIAISLFSIHAFGDAISPRLIGWISDARGLRVGIAATIVPLAAGGIFLMVGARGVPHQDAMDEPA
jgi:MFS family permease